MARKTLVKLLVLLILYEVLLVSVSEAKPWWWSSRRRRRCSSSTPSGVAWDNSWHKYFSVFCQNSYSIKHWRSQHRNCKEDRIHYFKCGYGPAPYSRRNCAWAGHYLNDFDKKLDFKCSHNGFITGVKSVYSSYHRDRRFNFRCCHVNGYKAHTCKTTLYQNDWDKEVYYRVPKGYYLVGVFSYHHNTHEDRRWKFEICQFRKSNGK